MNTIVDAYEWCYNCSCTSCYYSMYEHKHVLCVEMVECVHGLWSNCLWEMHFPLTIVFHKLYV